MRTQTLYYREGSSDKVYQAAIEPKNNLFVVNFAFGRRGSTMQVGTKTPTPVDLPTAERVFQKLIQEKTAKGYTPGESGTPYQHAENHQDSGLRPQLLNAIDEAAASRLVSSPDWCMQEKKDGKRLIVRKEGGAVHGTNRRGLHCGLPVPVVQEIMDFEHDFILDGEIVGDTYHVFDLLVCQDRKWMLRPYRERLNALDALLGQDSREHVLLVETFCDQLDKVDRLQSFQKSRAEGVVFKLLSAPYQAGRPNSGGPALKYKFTTTASCIVAGISKTKRSVRLCLFDEVYQKDAGNVTIPQNHPMPSIGDVVEIRYLYAFKESGALYQPVYLGRRDDLSLRECTTKQLKFKQEDEDDQ